MTMCEKVFTYVPTFDMDTAIFDKDREFHNAYKRKRQLEANSPNLTAYATGDVRPATSSYESRESPFHMFTDGDLIAFTTDAPEKRGRYTFGGFDFSIISTTNDSYGAIAMKHMHVLGMPDVKVNAAALSTQPDGETKDGRTLLINHVTDRVYSLTHSYERDVTTFEGVNLKEAWQSVPEKRGEYRAAVYITHPTGPAYVSTPVRLTVPVKLDSAYKDTLAACVAWFKMEGRSIHEYREEAIKNSTDPKAKYNMVSVNAHVDHDKVIERGFVGLSPYQRARVAVNNTKRKTPRQKMMMFCLGFNSEAFFNEIKERTAPKTRTETVPAF